MTVYNLSTVFNVVKAVMGFKTSEPTWSMVVPESAAVRASQRFSRVLIFPNHENHEDDASIMHHSPEGFTYLDLNQDLTPEEQRAEEEEHLVNTELPTGSTTSSVASVGNGHLRPEAHALLKGSPKALGWEVDEENEENAWVLLMSDAMRSSVFENIEDENEAGPSRSGSLQSKRELYKTYLEHWDDENTSLVWRVVPALSGKHTWVLEPRITSEHLLHSVVGVEVGTDTVDLLIETHAEASAQTSVKTYSEGEIQTMEVEAPVLTKESPPPVATSILDLLPSPMEITRPSTPDSSSSRPATPSRIPKMLPSRRASLASISSQFRGGVPRSTSPTPSIQAAAPLKRAPSIRSFGLRRVPSTKTSLGAGPTVNTDPDNNANSSTDGSDKPAAGAPASPPAVEPATSAPEAPTTAPGRFYNVVRRFALNQQWR